MKTSLAHLPQFKQDDLKRIVSIILACARETAGDGSQRVLGHESRVLGKDGDGGEGDARGDALGSGGDSSGPPRTQDARPKPAASGGAAGGGVELIILYGSNARGDAVYDKYVEDGITYEYVSDYDVLVIVDGDPVPGESGAGLHRNVNFYYDVLNRFAFGRPREGERSAGLSLIVHTLREVNKALEDNRFFFADIQREGIVLFDAKVKEGGGGGTKLATARQPTEQERRAKAKEEFEIWMENSDGFYSSYEHSLATGRLKNAAFQLHQTTEHLYTTVAMVFTDYRPKLHDLNKLRTKIAELDRRTLKGFAMHTDDQKRLFKLLADAYVHARYTKTYSITREELEYLAGRVQKLKGIVEEVCRERIES